jgi:hypothetical protein
MPRSSRLTLVVPALLADMTSADASSSDNLLSRIAGRGRYARRWSSDRREDARLQAWQRGLLHELALADVAYPSAPVYAVGESLDSSAKHWFHLDLVHFAAGLNDVTLIPLRGPTAVMPEEAAALASVIRPHLEQSGLELHEVSQRWLVESPDARDTDTVTAEFARTHEWSDAWPRGTDSGRLRRLMTELQMLLHENPVNQRRSARGMPAANAVWFWGNGRATPTTETQRAACAGRNAYLRGICRLHGWPHGDDASAAALMSQCEQSSSVVGVVDVASSAELDSQWLAPLLDGLTRKRFASLHLVLDEWDLTIDRWQLAAFWRGARPFDTWARP